MRERINFRTEPQRRIQEATIADARQKLRKETRACAQLLGGLCNVNAHWICGVRGPVLFFLTCIGTAFAVQECRADENTHIDFRTARGGVTSRSAGRYVTERSPVGRSEHPVRRVPSPNDRR